MSTLVDDSVGALSERLADLEHVETWANIEQALVSEIGKVKDEHSQSMVRLYDLFEKFGERQKSLERQLTGLRSFARHVEQFLEQHVSGGATALSKPLRTPRLESDRTTASQGQVPRTSSSSNRPPSYLQVPRPPTIPAPPVPQRNASPLEQGRVSTTHFSTVRNEVRSGAIRIDIANPEQWSARDTAILHQEAKRVRDIGSLMLETPIQHDYEAGVEVRSLLPTERLEEMDGRLAVTDEDPHTPGVRYVKFWVA